MTLEQLKEKGEAPSWLGEMGFRTLSKGYLLEDETPRGMYHRVANAAAKRLKKPNLAAKFFEIIDNGWLCLATPVACNMGTTRGLPISCYGQYVGDSIDGIFNSLHETAMLTKNGGGIGKYYGDVRGRGKIVGGNGLSKGIVPWLKNDEMALMSVSQGETRNGAGAVYLPMLHPDIDEFLEIRSRTGDQERRCRSKNFHHAIIIDDDFWKLFSAGDKECRRLWSKLLKVRYETGEPYVMFRDNVNAKRPEWYVKNNLIVHNSQLCSEIFLHNDEEHTYVCCLSSMNLSRWDEWKDTDAVQLAIWFLDGVMEEFIEKARYEPGFEKAVRFSEKSRALGLGVLGWHTLLQEKAVPFEGFEAMQLNAEIFRRIRAEADIATRKLAAEYGEVEWTKGFGVRNTHLMAVAPTMTNSVNAGGVSQGVEPFAANIFSQAAAKGTFIRKNPTLTKMLQAKGKDHPQVWDQINQDQGSVRHLKFLTDDEKATYKTAREISQFAIVQQAAQRQRWIDQGQSINLFFTKPDDIKLEENRQKMAKYIHETHVMAHDLGLFSLYYLRSEAAIKGDSVYRESSDCVSCES